MVLAFVALFVGAFATSYVEQKLGKNFYEFAKQKFQSLLGKAKAAEAVVEKLK